MLKPDFKNTFWLSIPLAAAIYVVSYLFGLLKIGVTPLFASVSATITPTLGDKVWTFISGITSIQFNLPTVALILLSSWATLILGTLIVGNWPKLAFLGDRLASIILLGGVPVYLFLIGFKIPSLITCVGALIWIFAVCYVTGFLGGWFKKFI